MFFITEDGKLLEGQLLTNAEAEAIEEIQTLVGSESTEYVSTRSRAKIVAALFGKYSITRRLEKIEVPQLTATELSLIRESVTGYDSPNTDM